MVNKKKTLTAEELDKKFDDGDEDMTEYLDLDSATKRVIVEFPLWMLKALDEEAKRLGVARQAVIKIWIDDKLQVQKSKNAV